MFVSIFDLYKIGIGPSSSHTVGPMVAAHSFIQALQQGSFHKDACHSWQNVSGPEGSLGEDLFQGAALGQGLEPPALRIKAYLHGSLAFTGVGHATDRAVMLGLSGQTPEKVDLEEAEQILQRIRETHTIAPPGHSIYAFDPSQDLIFDYTHVLPGHANGLVFEAYHKSHLLLRTVYYSIGGGFVVTEKELEETARNPLKASAQGGVCVPYGFQKASVMLEMAQHSGLTIAQMMRANEEALHGSSRVEPYLDKIWDVMDSCIHRGFQQEGVLPGGLKVARRAKDLYQKLVEEGKHGKNPLLATEWLCAYALAVNEENAAGGRVVTAPTNGAAGVIPAVLKYYLNFYPQHRNLQENIYTFLLSAAAIGGLIKANASISGAEVGCQGEIGAASSMAAAGLTAVLGGSPEQIENAAEIALEHHLGMTCDPVAGLVQVPCIERNSFGAVKAVTASHLALRGTGKHFVSLDACMETMRQTGHDMCSRYKETSLAGLAVNVVAC